MSAPSRAGVAGPKPLTEREKRLAEAFGVSKEKATAVFSSVPGNWSPEVIEIASAVPSMLTFVAQMEKARRLREILALTLTQRHRKC